jgi:hypothetical protein
MNGIVHRPIGPVDMNLVVLDASRRTYAALSRDRAYWHLVHPLPVDLVDPDGTVVKRVGALTCTCGGGIYRGTCYRVAQAEAFEAGQGLPDPAWLTEGFDAPAGAGDRQEAPRG